MEAYIDQARAILEQLPSWIVAVCAAALVAILGVFAAGFSAKRRPEDEDGGDGHPTLTMRRGEDGGELVLEPDGPPQISDAVSPEPIIPMPSPANSGGPAESSAPEPASASEDALMGARVTDLCLEGEEAYLEGDFTVAVSAFQEARGLILEAEKGAEKGEGGALAAALAPVLGNLALCHAKAGDGETAMELSLKALALEEKRFGYDHARVAAALNNLGLIHRSQGRSMEAEPILKRAHDIKEKVFAADDSSLVLARENYAAVLRDLDRLEDAAAYEAPAPDFQERAPKAAAS